MKATSIQQVLNMSRCRYFNGRASGLITLTKRFAIMVCPLVLDGRGKKSTTESAPRRIWMLMLGVRRPLRRRLRQIHEQDD